MTIQMVSFGADLLMLLTAVAVIVLLVAVVGQLVRRHARSAALLARVLVAIVVTYGAALIAVGLASSAPQQLKPGDTKCFDDWCVTMTGASQDAAGTTIVAVQLENRGRGRPMRSDLARAYLEIPGGREVAPTDSSGMQTMLPPGQRVDVRLTFPAVQSLLGARLVVVEDMGGLGPGTFEIGGEGSPFHGKVGWPL